MKYQIFVPVFVNGKVEYLPWARRHRNPIIEQYDSKKDARGACEFILPDTCMISEVENDKNS